MEPRKRIFGFVFIAIVQAKKPALAMRGCAGRKPQGSENSPCATVVVNSLGERACRLGLLAGAKHVSGNAGDETAGHEALRLSAEVIAEA